MQMARARALRKDGADAERLMRGRLRRKQLHGFKFRNPEVFFQQQVARERGPLVGERGQGPHTTLSRVSPFFKGGR